MSDSEDDNALAEANRKVALAMRGRSRRDFLALGTPGAGERVERQRIVVGGRRFLLHQASEDAHLDVRELHRCLSGGGIISERETQPICDTQVYGAIDSPQKVL